MNVEQDITQWLAQAGGDAAAAAERLMPQLYASLRQLAHRQRAREAAHTLQTTALVHEAYLTLARHGGGAFADRAHFYAYMSRVMRHLLIDHARRRDAHKRQAVADVEAQGESPVVDVLALDQALHRLAEANPRLARVAELRLFAELSNGEIGEVLGVNTRTVERDWLKARTFLAGCLLPEA